MASSAPTSKRRWTVSRPRSGRWPPERLLRTSPRAALLAAFPLILLAVACQATEAPEVETQDVVSQVPWQDGEVSTYHLEDDSGEEAGSGTLTVETEGDSVALAQSFVNEDNSDRWRISAGADDLKPAEVVREIHDGDECLELEVLYAGDFVEYVFASGGEARTEGGDVPENAYDSLSEVFLVRTLAFVDGLDLAANAVFAARPDGQPINDFPLFFGVAGPETVEVPAGRFEAWRILVRGGPGHERIAWVNVEPPHQLVRFEFVDQLTYLLTEFEAGGSPEAAALPDEPCGD
ncbi:MAG: DUF3108 domain-containing protein [Dehalococcoidia bacterium]|nr:DUF3108 domain-containing protein [Dehalococcoidia bacterium]